MEKWPYIVLLAVISIAIILVSVLGSLHADLAPVYGIVLTAGLVGITAVYVYETGKIAKATEIQAKETQRQRHAAFRPILAIEGDLNEIDPRDRAKTLDHLVRAGGNFPSSWPCKRISNVGVGPALGVQWSIHLGSAGFAGQDEIRYWDVSVIRTGETVEVKGIEGYLHLEDIQGKENRKVIRVKYKDIFGNEFESRRETWLKGEGLKIGPLQISEIPREEQTNQ